MYLIAPSNNPQTTPFSIGESSNPVMNNQIPFSFQWLLNADDSELPFDDLELIRQTPEEDQPRRSTVTSFDNNYLTNGYFAFPGVVGADNVPQYVTYEGGNGQNHDTGLGLPLYPFYSAGSSSAINSFSPLEISSGLSTYVLEDINTGEGGKRVSCKRKAPTHDSGQFFPSASSSSRRRVENYYGQFAVDGRGHLNTGKLM